MAKKEVDKLVGLIHPEKKVHALVSFKITFTEFVPCCADVVENHSM